jgi:hypothetical protein
VLNSRVTSVRDGHVKVQDKAGKEQELQFGACVWATGIAMNPLVKQLQEAFPTQQTHFRCACLRTCACVEGARIFLPLRTCVLCPPRYAWALWRWCRVNSTPCSHTHTHTHTHTHAHPTPRACRRSLLTDEFLRVKGSDGSIWAFGDAATIDQPRALQRADELFTQADVNKVGRVAVCCCGTVVDGVHTCVCGGVC